MLLPMLALVTCWETDYYDVQKQPVWHAVFARHADSQPGLQTAFMLYVQSYTAQDTLGDAMICLLQQLPRLQWTITTLGKKGSVLVERAPPQDAADTVVLDDTINNMLSEAASSSANGTRGHHSGQGSPRPADCTSKGQTEIRLTTYVLGLSCLSTSSLCSTASASLPARVCQEAADQSVMLQCCRISICILSDISIHTRFTDCWVMLCRAGKTLASGKAFRLRRSSSSQPQQDAASSDQGGNCDLEGAVAGRVTVATAAEVPLVGGEATLWWRKLLRFVYAVVYCVAL